MHEGSGRRFARQAASAAVFGRVRQLDVGNRATDELSTAAATAWAWHFILHAYAPAIRAVEVAHSYHRRRRDLNESLSDEVFEVHGHTAALVSDWRLRRQLLDTDGPSFLKLARELIIKLRVPRHYQFHCIV